MLEVQIRRRLKRDEDGHVFITVLRNWTLTGYGHASAYKSFGLCRNLELTGLSYDGMSMAIRGDIPWMSVWLTDVYGGLEFRCSGVQEFGSRPMSWDTEI